MQLSTPRTIILTTLTAIALSLTGCVADPEIADDLPDRGSAPSHVAEATFPDTEVADMSQWVVDQLNATRSINKQDWYPRVSPEMSDDIPVDSLVGTLNAELRPSLPYIPSEYEEPEADYGVTRLTPDLTAEPLDLHVQIEDTGLITALWYENIDSDSTSDVEDTSNDEDSETGDGIGQ